VTGTDRDWLRGRTGTGASLCLANCRPTFACRREAGSSLWNPLTRSW
jgi:hypothetical protein